MPDSDVLRRSSENQLLETGNVPLVKATTEGVVRAPSEFSRTLGDPASKMETHEFVVPRSIPITGPETFELKRLLPTKGEAARCACQLAAPEVDRGIERGVDMRRDKGRLPATGFFRFFPCQVPDPGVLDSGIRVSNNNAGSLDVDTYGGRAKGGDGGRAKRAGDTVHGEYHLFCRLG